MREFTSYGSIDKNLHYHVPRRELMKETYGYLVGESPDAGGHYITVWAPGQTGKSSLLQDVYRELLGNPLYDAVYINVQSLGSIEDSQEAMNRILFYINEKNAYSLPRVKSAAEFQEAFSVRYLKKPLVLIIDEFDALTENVINDLVVVFRNIYNDRAVNPDFSARSQYLLHGVALIGVRSVVGVENKKGSPFNIQRSMQVQNLTVTEVNEMFNWYTEETGQPVEQEVIDRIFYITSGQPGLVGWFGELLTRQYNEQPEQPLNMKNWTAVYNRALQVLPNNNIINIISKATSAEYRPTVLNLFRIDHKELFEFEEPHTGYLYMHGVISYEETEGISYIKFPCQFVQEKLYRRFSREFGQLQGDLLVDPFIDLTPIINENTINIEKLLELYQDYYTSHKERLTEHAQRRVDLGIKEVVYHFQLYSWLDNFLRNFGTQIFPEFPTGNGKIDLLIRHRGILYGLELKSFSQIYLLNKNIEQASEYGNSLGLAEITLVVFIDRPLPDELHRKYTKPHTFKGRATVNIFFIMT